MEKKIKTKRKLTYFFRRAFLSPKIFGVGVEHNYVFSARWHKYTSLEDASDLAIPYNRPFDKQEVFNDVPIGFTFNFNGTKYRHVSICENGYIKMGKVIALPTYQPLSNHYTDNKVISAFGAQLTPSSGSRLLYKVTGIAGDKVFTVEWRNYCVYGTGSFNFQIKLHEKNHLIECTYGSFNPIIPVCAQIGLRGAGTFDVNNIFVNKKTNTWLKPLTGRSSHSFCEVLVDTTSFFGPISGLSYVWTPF